MNLLGKKKKIFVEFIMLTCRTLNHGSSTADHRDKEKGN